MKSFTSAFALVALASANESRPVPAQRYSSGPKQGNGKGNNYDGYSNGNGNFGYGNGYTEAQGGNYGGPESYGYGSYGNGIGKSYGGDYGFSNGGKGNGQGSYSGKNYGLNKGYKNNGSFGGADQYGFSGYGRDSGYGNDYGNSGYGNSGYGNNGYGNSGYGNGYGNSGYGNDGYGSGYGHGGSYGGHALGSDPRTYSPYNLDGSPAIANYGHGDSYGSHGSGYGGQGLPYGGLQSHGPSYGHGSHGSHGVRGPIGNRAYKPAVANKDYGQWAKSYNLTTETFTKTVETDEENVWVVAFIDPACGYCKKFVIEWEKVKTIETVKQRKVKFGYVDITLEDSRQLVTKYAKGRKIEYTPTVFLYGKDKKAPAVYDGDHTSGSLNAFICGYCDK